MNGRRFELPNQASCLTLTSMIKTSVEDPLRLTERTTRHSREHPGNVCCVALLQVAIVGRCGWCLSWRSSQRIFLLSENREHRCFTIPS